MAVITVKPDEEKIKFWDGKCINCKSENLKLLEMPPDEDGVSASYVYQCNECGKKFEILRYFGPHIDC